VALDRKMNIGQVLNKLSIRGRIFLLAGLTVSSIFMIGGGFLWNYSVLQTAFEKKHHFQKLGEYGSEMHAANLMLRQTEKDFLLSKNEEYLTAHAEASRILNRDLSSFKDTVQEDELYERVSVLQKDFSGYQRQFSVVVDETRVMGFTEKTGLLGALNSSGTKLEESLDETNLPKIQVAFLKSRKAEKEYVLNQDKVSERYFKIFFRNVKKGLAKSSISDERKTVLTEQAAQYEKAFADYVKLNKTVNQQIGALVDIEEKLQQGFDGIFEFAEDHQQKADAEYMAAREQFLLVMLILCLVTLMLYVVISVPISRSLTNPISKITKSLQALSDGDKNVRIDMDNQGHEIGAMVSAVKKFHEAVIAMEEAEKEKARERENRLAMEKETMEKERQLAQQKAEKEEQERKTNLQKQMQLEKICLDFENILTSVMGNVRSAAGSMEESAQKMFSLADSTSGKSSNLAATSEQSAQNAQNVSQTAGELMRSVDSINSKANVSTKSTSAAVVEIEKADQQIRELEDASIKIGDVLKLINEIADQTNLLALNATIEAARAGEAGKGFAVVASEVKNLADETTKATEQIDAQIGNMQSITEEAVNAIEKITKVIEQTNESAEVMAASIQEQHAATTEISQSAQSASQSTQETSGNIDKLHQAARDTLGSADKVKNISTELGAQSSRLSTVVDELLAELRSDVA